MIDYETFARIRDCHDRQGLTIMQTARVLGIDPRTVAKWLARARYERPRPIPRSSLLDPFKGRITRLLDTHPYSAQQIFQRLREEGYGGGITILRDYVRLIRPPKLPVYLKLHFAPGECAQVDWGAFGTVAIGIPWWRWAYPAIESALLKANNGALRTWFVVVAIAWIVSTAGGAWAFAYH